MGTDRSIQSLDIMYPLSHSKSSLIFTDLRGRIDDDDSVEVNLGLAHRFVADDPLGLSDESILGFYGFADRLESRFDNTFYQATSGFEYFTKNYSLRVNAYFPEDTRKRAFTTNPVKVTGSQIYFDEFQNYERPLPGYDVEVGRTVRFDGWQLYGRGSYYRFHHSDFAVVEGSRFRTGLQFNGSHPHVALPDDTQLTIGLEWSGDHVRGDRTFGVARFSVPFGTIENDESTVEGQKSEVEGQPQREDSNSELRSWQKDRLTERVSRDVDIVTGGRAERTGETYPAVVANSNRKLSDVALARASASGTGTLTSPGSLETAMDRAGPEGTVFVSGGAGTLETAGETLPEGQALYGGNTAIPLKSPDGSIRKVFRLNEGDRRPTIRGTTNLPTLGLDTGVLRGLNVDGDVRVLEDASVRIRNVDVKNGGITVGDNAGRGSGSAFTMRNVTSEGSIVIGDHPGQDNGSVTLRNVETEGRLDIGLNAGVLGGSFEMSGVDVTDDVVIGDGAGNSDGSFRMKDVVVEQGTLDIADNAGRSGFFSMRDVEVEEGGALVGLNAGTDNGVFRIRDLDVEGTLYVDRLAGSRDGSFSMKDVTVREGNAHIEGFAGANNGRFAMDTVTVKKGFLDIGKDAGGEFNNSTGGRFTAKHLDVNDTLTVDENAGGQEGRFEFEDVDVGDTFHFGGTGSPGSNATVRLRDVESGDFRVNKFPKEPGDWTMSDIETHGDLRIGTSAGSNDGSFVMRDVDVDSGSLFVGKGAGIERIEGPGRFLMESVDVSDSIDVGPTAGQGGSFTMRNVYAGDSVSIGEDAGGGDGVFEMIGVESDGNLLVEADVGRNGEFRMNEVTADSMDLRKAAARDGGTFIMRNSTVRQDLSMANGMGHNGGFFRIENSTVEAEGLSPTTGFGTGGGVAELIGNTVHGGITLPTETADNASVRLISNTVRNGNLLIKSGAGINGGDLLIEENAVPGGDLTVKSPDTSGIIRCFSNSAGGSVTCD